MKIILFMLLVTVFGVSVPVFADTYQWVDDKGSVNFTDNPANIPKKYQKKVKVLPLDISGGDSSPSQEGSPAPDETQSPESGQYGGHDKAWWTSRYGGLRGELKSIQNALPAKREELEALRRQQTVYTFPRNRITYQNKLEEIQKDEARIGELQSQLAELEAEATRAGVPFDWRE